MTDVARSFAPLIAALERYRSKNGHYPDLSLPGERDAIEAETRVKVIAQGGIIGISTPNARFPHASYVLDSDRDGFSLSIKLGWDPRLVYTGGKGPRWVFVPGDGSDEREVALRP